MVDRADQVRLYFFYDSECELCCRFKEWIERRDREGAIRVLGLDDPELPELFPELDLEAAQEQLTVRDREGNFYRGLTALRQLSLHLPGIRRLDWIYRLPGVGTVATGLYRTVNRYRKRLCLSCGEKWMPSRKHSQRKKRQPRRRGRF